MKRSQINRQIREAEKFFSANRFFLPPWAFWKPEEWKGKGQVAREIIENMLGWDLTDFGSGEFEKTGLLLFTLRNGNTKNPSNRKIYAEKIMVVRELQETPFHFHWRKSEDIINRGGGNLVIELYPAGEDQQLADERFFVKIDGIERTVEPGGEIVLTPGESICLEPHIYHRFYGQEGQPMVLVGEVSAVNDDTSDNRFLSPCGRFPTIEEDEEPLHLLVTDYPRYV